MLKNNFLYKLILIFRYLAAEEDTFLGGEQMLFEILYLDLFNIPAIEVAMISVEADDRKRKGETASIRGLLKEKAHRPPADLFDQGLHPGLVRISDSIEGLMKDLSRPGKTFPGSDSGRDVPNIKTLFNRIVIEFGLAEYAAENNFDHELQSISALIDKASELNPLMNPRELVSFLRDQTADWPAPATSSEKPVLAPLDRFFISKRLEKFVMNVSALNNYLRCPLQFYYHNILRIPAGKSEAQGFGSSMHYAVEKLFEKMKSNPGEAFPTKEEMVADFKSHMMATREIFTQESFARKLAHGETVIANYYQRYIHSWKKIVLIESNIRNVNFRGVPLKGKLDKIEFNGREVNIVDYKTGSYERALEQMNRPGEENPFGGNYWRQAVFYHLLVELRPGKPWIPVSTEFDFLEPDLTGEFRKVRFMITDADKETVGQQITSTWEKIQLHDFYTGCGREDCYWCRL